MDVKCPTFASGHGKRTGKVSYTIHADSSSNTGGKMNNLETLLDRGGGENQLTEELTKLYGGPLGFERRSEARPFVVVNFVTTIEGLTSYGIPGKAGGGWISGFNKQDVFIMGLLRSFADGVAVGANTLRSEPEHLWTSEFIDKDHETEFVKLRQSLSKSRKTPLQIFVTSSGNVLDTTKNLPKAFLAPDVETLIVTTEEGKNVVKKEFQKFSAVPGVLVAYKVEKPNEVNIPMMMDRLERDYGIEFLLVEGGSGFNGSVTHAEQYDEYFQTISPKIIGTDKKNPRQISVSGFERSPENSLPHNLISVKTRKNYLFLRWRLNQEW
jgi:riboflavin biosynthesis pyrimidine reductase